MIWGYHWRSDGRSPRLAVGRGLLGSRCQRAGYDRDARVARFPRRALAREAVTWAQTPEGPDRCGASGVCAGPFGSTSLREMWCHNGEARLALAPHAARPASLTVPDRGVTDMGRIPAGCRAESPAHDLGTDCACGEGRLVGHVVGLCRGRARRPWRCARRTGRGAHAFSFPISSSTCSAPTPHGARMRFCWRVSS